jgi:hypothetical protein
VGGKDVEIEDRFELEKCIEEQPLPLAEYMEDSSLLKSLEERARYVFILSPVMVVGDVGSSSKGDVTLYKAIGGSSPKSCKATFHDRAQKVQIMSYLR